MEMATSPMRGESKGDTCLYVSRRGLPRHDVISVTRLFSMRVNNIADSEDGRLNETGTQPK